MRANQKLLSTFDLNLVRVFLTVYQARSVSRAAVLLNVGQPAVSASLVRLRKRFDDPLFVRMGRIMVATDRAEKLAAYFMPALLQIELAMNFCPRPS